MQSGFMIIFREEQRFTFINEKATALQVTVKSWLFNHIRKKAAIYSISLFLKKDIFSVSISMLLIINRIIQVKGGNV